MEQVDALERRIGQPLRHLQRVAHVEAYVRQRAVADMPQRADDAVQERLAADEARARMRRRLRHQMLARAEADLQLQRPVVAEQCPRVERPRFRYRDLRQQLLDQRGLTGAQFVALAAAVEAADGGGVVHRRAP